MKAKTSITLSVQLLVQIDKMIGEGASRSAYIEKVLREHLRKAEREAIQLRDMELINAAADRLNAKAEDALEYQEALYFDLVGEKDPSHNAVSISPEREDHPEAEGVRIAS